MCLAWLVFRRKLPLRLSIPPWFVDGEGGWRGQTCVRWAQAPTDRKPCIILSRFLSGRWEFSALLLRPLWDRCSTLGTTWRRAAPYEDSLSVIMRLGNEPCFFISRLRLKWSERSDRHIRNLSFIMADKVSHLLRRMCADVPFGRFGNDDAV